VSGSVVVVVVSGAVVIGELTENVIRNPRDPGATIPYVFWTVIVLRVVKTTINVIWLDKKTEVKRPLLLQFCKKTIYQYMFGW